MANWNTPKSTGEYIGEVTEVRGNILRVKLKDGVTLHNGDGLTIGSEGCSVNGVEGNIIKINKNLSPALSPREGVLYRNLDVEFVRSLHAERHIPVEVFFKETVNGFEILYKAISSGNVWRGAFDFPHEAAKNETKAIENIRVQLSKLGDTPYIAQSVQIESKPYFIPISVLNQWRRETLQPLSSAAPSPSSIEEPTESHHSLSTAPREEVGKDLTPLMTCKYCLLFESGHCRKLNPYPKDKEPRFLRLRTGKVLALHFDCKNCQMLIDEC
jgi:putative protease